jgi:hypothetical protein
VLTHFPAPCSHTSLRRARRIAVTFDLVFLVLDSIELDGLLKDAAVAASNAKGWEDLNSASQSLRMARSDLLLEYTKLSDAVEVMTGGQVWVRTVSVRKLDVGEDATTTKSIAHTVHTAFDSGECCGPGEADDELYAQTQRVPALQGYGKE